MTPSRPGRSTPVSRASGPWILRHPAAAAATMLAIVMLAWILWPSGLSSVRNVDSRGSNIIAFGDSLTAGYGAASGEDFPSQLTSMTAIPIINAGVSGDTTETALKRLDSDVLSRNPRIVIVGLGGNDYLRQIPIATTEENLRTIVREIQTAGSAVVLLGFRFPSITANYGSMYERIASEEGCLYIPDMLDGILANASLKSDEIHPNGKGYALMAERIRKPLQRLVSKAESYR